MFNQLVEQKVTVQVAQRREFSSHRSSIYGIGEQLLDETAHLIALRIEQRAPMLLEKLRELCNVSVVGRNRERRQPLLDLQVIEEVGNHAGIRFRGHSTSMRVIGRSGK